MTKDDIPMAKPHMKRFLTTLVTREVQVTAVVRSVHQSSQSEERRTVSDVGVDVKQPNSDETPEEVFDGITASTAFGGKVLYDSAVPLHPKYTSCVPIDVHKGSHSSSCKIPEPEQSHCPTAVGGTNCDLFIKWDALWLPP